MKASAALSDIVNDQTNAHDPLNGYLPQNWGVAKRGAKRESDPKAVGNAARANMKPRVAAMIKFWNADVPTLNYRNNIRHIALREGLETAFAFPGFVPVHSGPYSAVVSTRPAGWPFWASPRISAKPTPRLRSYSPKTLICTIG